jgi:hypothetical protein
MPAFCWVQIGSATPAAGVGRRAISSALVRLRARGVVNALVVRAGDVEGVVGMGEGHRSSRVTSMVLYVQLQSRGGCAVQLAVLCAEKKVHGPIVRILVDRGAVHPP